MIDLDALQAAAEAAVDLGGDTQWYSEVDLHLATDFEEADVAFIAAANPAVILKWAADHRAALSRIARVEALHERIGASWPHNGGVYVCRADGGIWPCPTVRALTEGEPDE